MTYYTHHKSMDALLCVCVDELSECPVRQMIYYTHHRKMAAPHYVCAGAWSVY
jgi:hypothetical protein